MRFLLRKRPTLQHPKWVLLFSLLPTILYWDYYEYYFPKWFNIDCQNEEDCTRILLVADPQIIGLRNEMIHFITPISIWDSDRYLAKTYSIAKKHAKPDLVLFLGDLFDEGSVAYEVEYKTYVSRLTNIFNLDDDKLKHIFVPGDNDIGGEGREPVKDNKIKFFENAFGHTDISEIHNMTFYSVNYLKRTIPNVEVIEELSPDDAQLRIVVSHVPLLFKPSLFSDKVLNKLRPHLLFAGHEHSSMIVSNEPIVQVRHVLPVTASDRSVHEMYLKMDETYEVIAPACSYRMGTVKMGYGLAVIENNELRYTVLWSPSRFHQLAYYLIVLCANFWYIVYYKCRECWRTKSKNNNYTHINSNSKA
ncbi:uncharacterized protein Mppe isoform X3 [Atheta coriaria]|uniref:uncharacterized protein Mppe isoform X3 n=1 Tax=Dalotia coriaria TaxID=877792 RepID=UPI0031F340C1